MQKLVNVLALLFVGTASIVGAGAYVYTKRTLIERAKVEQLKQQPSSQVPTG